MLFTTVWLYTVDFLQLESKYLIGWISLKTVYFLISTKEQTKEKLYR